MPTLRRPRLSHVSSLAQRELDLRSDGAGLPVRRRQPGRFRQCEDDCCLHNACRFLHVHFGEGGAQSVGFLVPVIGSEMTRHGELPTNVKDTCVLCMSVMEITCHGFTDSALKPVTARSLDLKI